MANAESNSDRFVARAMLWDDAPCNDCARYRRGVVCDAFPDGEGIPVDILTGDNDHRAPVEGDHGLLFKLKTKK